MRPIFILTFLIFIASFAEAENIAPKVDANLSKFSGDFDKEAIRRSINAHKKKLESCKSDRSSLDFSVEFQIDQNGKARGMTNHGFPLPSDKAVDCINKVFSEMQFPTPATDSTDWVMVPLKYEEPASVNPEKEQASKVSNRSNDSEESVADKKNQEYLNQVKANALKAMNEENAKQNLVLKAKLACLEQYRKDSLLEKRDRCLADAQYGGRQAAASTPESLKSCHKTCESQRPNLEIKCQNCGGNHIARNNCISQCHRNISEKIELCRSGCR